MGFDTAPADLDFTLVLGCPRSGTTFLMRALNTVPDAECVTGIIFPAAVSQIVSHPPAPEIYEALVVEFKQSLLRYLHSGLFQARAASLQKWWASSGNPAGLVHALQGKRTVHRLIYKEPFLSFAPAFAHRALPDARFIYLYRDGRDCADSLVRTYDVLTDDKLRHLRSAEMRLGRQIDHRYAPAWVTPGHEDAFLAASPYGRAIWMWKVMAQRCHTFFSRPALEASGHVLFLCYEDLMHEPLKYGQAVADHLGIPMNNRFAKRLKDAHTRSIGIHKRRPVDEIRAAEHIAGDELRRYGYL